MSNEVGPKYINPNKKYGLILPNKIQPVTKPQKPLKLAAFDEDDELEEEETTTTTTKYKVNTNETRLKKATQINIEKALEEDPNIFEYDNIYDELETEKSKLDPKSKNKSKEPKYIAGLMKAHAVRQMEYERRQDRKIQKEREEEGDMFGDKEAFVTENYRRRMEERQRLEEEERKQEQIEALLDVKKAKNLSAIHDTLLKMKTGELVIEEESEKEKRLERERREKEELRRKEAEEEKFAKIAKDVAEKIKSKSYRTRKEEESSEEEEEYDNKNDGKVDENIEEDRDEKISDDEDNEEPKSKKSKVDEEDIKVEVEAIKIESKPAKEEAVEKPKVKKPETKEERWKRLFKKRTAGKGFDQEIGDYYRRKNNMLSMKLYIERE